MNKTKTRVTCPYCRKRVHEGYPQLYMNTYQRCHKCDELSVKRGIMDEGELENRELEIANKVLE